MLFTLMISTLLRDAQELQPDVVRLRRAIHRQPELGLHLPRTQAAVIQTLDGLGLSIRTGERLTSVVAMLEGTRPGPSILLRADMDALPVQEETGLEFASGVEGVMHACGHDAHVAMLVGAARLLARRRDQLAGRGGHASAPHDCLDPIPIACEIVQALQTFVTRRVDVFDPAVITIAKIEAGSTRNVIPETALMFETART